MEFKRILLEETHKRKKNYKFIRIVCACVGEAELVFANYILFQHCEFISFCHAPDMHTNARSGSNFQLTAICFEKSFVCALGGGDKSQNALGGGAGKTLRRFVPPAWFENHNNNSTPH